MKLVCSTRQDVVSSGHRNGYDRAGKSRCGFLEGEMMSRNCASALWWYHRSWGKGDGLIHHTQLSEELLAESLTLPCCGMKGKLEELLMKRQQQAGISICVCSRGKALLGSTVLCSDQPHLMYS